MEVMGLQCFWGEWLWFTFVLPQVLGFWIAASTCLDRSSHWLWFHGSAAQGWKFDHGLQHCKLICVKLKSMCKCKCMACKDSHQSQPHIRSLHVFALNLQHSISQPVHANNHESFKLCRPLAPILSNQFDCDLVHSSCRRFGVHV